MANQENPVNKTEIVLETYEWWDAEAGSLSWEGQGDDLEVT